MTDPNDDWSEVRIGEHHCELYEPGRCNEHGFAVIYLHSAVVDCRAEVQPFLERLRAHGLPVVAPVTQRSWWGDKICPEFDATTTPETYLLDRVVPYLGSRWSTGPGQVGLLGIGMGGQGALRLAYKHPTTFPVVAALAPTIDYQSQYEEDVNLQRMYPDPEAVRQDTATLHVHPLNWPRHQFFCCDPAEYMWWESADRLRMKLSSLGVPHECDLDTTAQADTRAYCEAMAERTVRFLAQGLDQERLRLV